ncbi:2-dehydropantoate 2-reductase [Bacillus sp. 165]|uniref:ketopantoate reductase family protein n=1 Tax=Bacillus sp. 165 TaxID=1529117 RepID=UPI001AD9E293|nr:2-dehydropantoate 2-reductase [Bacillus sp. 165]MBO9129439.1 2-dehydropantoate 2-reductase [Bacillus sp. 165]
MKVGIVGAGAVGGFFGGQLQKAGHDVTFLARGQHLKAMQENGLLIHANEQTMKIESEFTNELSRLSEAELILFCVKSMDTEETAHQLLPIVKQDAYILTLQNGVENEEILSNVFGKERVFSSATYIQASLQEPGVIKQAGPFHLEIGELCTSSVGMAKQVAELLNASGIRTKHSSEIMENKWKKYIWNATFNPLSAALGVNVGEILDNEDLRLIAERMCKEVIKVAQKHGIQVHDSLQESLFMQTQQIARGHKTSMLQDRINGKKMELESISGYVVRKGKELDVPVPTSETIYHILKHIETANKPLPYAESVL